MGHFDFDTLSVLGMMIADEASWVYLINVLISITGTLFFLWWWIKKRDASTMYIFITIWIIGNGVTAAANIYARFIGITIPSTPGCFREVLLHSWWWPKRFYIETLAGMLVIGTIIKRVVFNKKSGSGSRNDIDLMSIKGRKGKKGGTS